MTKKRWIVLIIFMILFIAAIVCFSIFGPFSSHEAQYLLPTDYDIEEQTLDDVIAFLAEDKTDTRQCEKGFNCVDFAFTVWLNARWEGIVAVPIAIQYEESPSEESSGHMVIGFPIGDKGFVLFEPQNDQQINLNVGQIYEDRKVKGLYYLDIVWKPLPGSPDYDADREIE
ncbi:MAG: hypothetical protein PVJ08_08730, partial [Dehalococcoidia bacterium]